MVVCGRRFGKTLLFGDLADDIAIDQALPVGWFAPTYKLLTEAWREMHTYLAPIVTRSNATEHRIELLTGGTIDFWTLEDPNAGRSRKYRRVIVDEAGLVKNLVQVWNTAIRPTLADYAGDAFIGGTPKGRNGFWELWQMAGQTAGWARWRYPTDANPYIRPEEIAAMRAAMPQIVAAQELDAEFVENGTLFRYVNERATARPQLSSADTNHEHQYVMGCDWGKSEDFTVLSIVDMQTRELVEMDRFNQIDYQVQLGRLRALYDRFKPIVIVAEQNSIGTPIIEQLWRMDLPVQPFVTTNATKAKIIEGLLLAFEQGTISILNDPILIAELQAFTVSKTALGLPQYSAPAGMHDDCVMSLALAWSAAHELEYIR